MQITKHTVRVSDNRTCRTLTFQSIKINLDCDLKYSGICYMVLITVTPNITFGMTSVNSYLFFIPLIMQLCCPYYPRHTDHAFST